MRFLLVAPLVLAATAVSARSSAKFSASLYGPPTQEAYAAGVLRQPFFDRIVSQGVNLISGILGDTQIPSLSQTVSVPVIGDVKVDINNARVLALSIDTTRSSISLSNGYLAVGIGGLSLDFKSDYKYKQQRFPKVGGSGTGTVTARDGTIAFDLRFSFAKDGTVSTQLDRVYTNFGKIDIDVNEGTAKWFYNIIFDLFSGIVRDQVSKQIQTQLQNKVPEALNKLFASMPLNVDLKNLLTLDTRFAGDGPVVQPNGLYVYNDLAFGSIVRANVPCPYRPEPATAVLQSPSNMVVVSLHEAALNCALWAIRDDGILNLKVTNDQLPSGIAILQTDSWEEVFPGLATAFPNKPLELAVSFPKDIQATVVPNKGIKINAVINLEWIVLPTEEAQLVTEVSVEAIVNPSLVKDPSTGDWKLKVDLVPAGATEDDILVISGRVLSTKVEPVYENVFDETLNDLAPIIVSALEDQLLNKGFGLPIPKEFLTLVAAQVVLSEKQVNLGVDIALGQMF